MTHCIQKEVDVLQIYFCVTFHETRQYAQAHITSGTLCALSLTARRTQTAAPADGLVISLASVCCGDFC
jgi:hypothetical protein